MVHVCHALVTELQTLIKATALYQCAKEINKDIKWEWMDNVKLAHRMKEAFPASLLVIRSSALIVSS